MEKYLTSWSWQSGHSRYPRGSVSWCCPTTPTPDTRQLPYCNASRNIFHAIFGLTTTTATTTTTTTTTIDWKKTTVIDRELGRPTRWIKEAVHIRKEGHQAMNRDEGSYQLSHAYDHLLHATADRRIKSRNNWVPASSDEDLVIRSKRQNKALKFWCDIWIFYFVLLYQPNEFISRYYYSCDLSKVSQKNKSEAILHRLSLFQSFRLQHTANVTNRFSAQILPTYGSN